MEVLVKLVLVLMTRIMVVFDREDCFMKHYALIGIALIFTASCAKVINVEESNPENAKSINITVVASEKPAVDTETKTFIDGTSIKWSSSGEFLRVFEVASPKDGEPVTTPAQSAEGKTDDGGATMSFSVSLTDKSEGYESFDYYAVYPSSAYQSGSLVNAVTLNTKGAQNPSATNFDPEQDLLIAKKLENGSRQASTLEMRFARVVAIGKMTIKNLNTTDPITKIIFSAKVGEDAVALAGRTIFDLESASPVTKYASNTQDYSIILNYDGQNITANTSEGMVAYFTCYPFAINAETPGSFKVEVETAFQTFEKEVSVSSEKGLALNAGKASVFSVDMAGIYGKAKAVNLCYAYLDYNDFSDAGGSGSYSNVTVAKPHGDSWVTFACLNSNAIGVRNNGNANDSYIKLPDFDEDIKQVVVTLKNVADNKTISLETSATNYTGTVKALTTTSTTSVYTFDLEDIENKVKTAYFRSNGAQALVEKIEVYAGEDNRSKISAPTSIKAAVDAENANTINVSWDDVSGAASYIVTLESDGNDDVVVKTVLPAVTVPNLENSTNYRVGVQAVPNDEYINIASDIAYAEDSVTTGTGTIDYSTIETSNVELVSGNNGSTAKVNGQDAIKVGNSSKGGDMKVTVPSGTTKLHVHAAAWNNVSGLSLLLSSSLEGTSCSPSSLSLNFDSGISGSGPSFTLSETPKDYYFEINLSGIIDDTEITFSSSIDKRFVVWGVNAESVVDERSDVKISFDKDSFELEVDSDDYTGFKAQTATIDPSSLAGEIVYAISDDSGITSEFNSSNGSFTLTGKTGIATITASYAGDDSYRSATASYTVMVYAAGTNPFAPVKFTFSRNKNLDTITDGFKLTTEHATPKETFYQDNSSEGLDLYFTKTNSNEAFFTVAPTTITLKVKVGGGTLKSQLTNNVIAYLVDRSGNNIDSTSTIVTTKVESTDGTEYTVSMPLISEAYGLRIHHTKETSYNTRIFEVYFLAE